jgi:hypothetical protein
MKLPSTLAPMPVRTPTHHAAPARRELGEFVEFRLDQVVATPPRPFPAPEDLVLAADENDFAGWMLPPRATPQPSAERAVEVKPEAPPSPVWKRFESPSDARPAIRNRWIRGGAIAAAVLILAILLFILAGRPPASSPGTALPLPAVQQNQALPQAPADPPPTPQTAASVVPAR